MRSGWTRFVALFMVAFALFDVCAPKSCVAELAAASQSGAQVRANSPEREGDSTCQFEEDCLACAHILACSHFVLENAVRVSFGEPDRYLSALDGTLALPYHPPRA
jgi:hypothetical protein